MPRHQRGLPIILTILASVSLGGADKPFFKSVGVDKLPLVYISASPDISTPLATESSPRYTMDDIHVLNHRIENLEIAAQLNDLETAAERSSSDLLKRGIFTDTFRDFSRMDSGFETTPMEGGTVPPGGNANDNFDYIGNEPAATGDGAPDTTLPHIKNNIALFPLGESIRLPLAITNPTATSPRLHSGISYINSVNIRAGNQTILLDYTEETSAAQPYATDTIQINPYAVFDPALHLTIDEPIDFFVDLDMEPSIPASINDDEVKGDQNVPSNRRRPLPAKLLRDRLFGWWDEFLFGVKDSRTVPPIQAFPSAFNVTDSDGNLAQSIGNNASLAQGNVEGIGFTPNPRNVHKRVMRDRYNDGVVVARDLVPFLPSRDVTISGQLFPPAATITATIAGKKVKLDGADSTLASASGSFSALATIPTGVPVGANSILYRPVICSLLPSTCSSKLSLQHAVSYWKSGQLRTVYPRRLLLGTCM